MNSYQDLLAHFKGMTREQLAAAANLKLTIILIRELAAGLNLTENYAAQIVGKMKIEVDNESYNADPDTFNELAKEMVRIIRVLFDTIKDEFGEKTAYSYIESSAAQLSLTYG